MEELFNKNIQETTKILLDAWKLSELRLVGKFIPYTDKFGVFEDIRTTDYVNLFYPANVEDIADEKLTIFTHTHPNLSSEIYYEFDAILQPLYIRREKENPFLLKTDFSKNGPIEFKPNPKTFIQRRYEIAKNTPLLTQDQLSKSIDTITSDINKKPETFIYELLQNADDYPQPSLKKVEVVFRINGSFLQFMHSGLPFSVKNVHAICGVNEKDKGDDIEKIGFKGIGFKSVFRDSDYALIKSGGFQFRFDEKHHSTKTYWQTIPIWTETEDKEFDVSLRTDEFLNAPVSIALKPKNSRVLVINDDSYAVTLKRVFADPKILLFLRHVNEVSVVIPNAEVIFCEKNLKDWWKKSEKIKVPEEQKLWLNERIIEPKLRDKRIPEKFYNLNESCLSFATRRQGNKILKTENSNLYIYLPTQIDLKFSFLINGDFIPDASREELHNDIIWNDYLMQEAGFMFVKWLNETGNNRWKDRNGIEFQFNKDYINLIPNFSYCKNSIDNKHHYLINAFNQGFDKAIKYIAFIPDYNNQLRRLDEILIDETGLFILLGLEYFKATINSDLYPIHAGLQDNNIIRKLLSDYGLDDQVLGDDTLEIWVENQPNEWFQNIENNACFINLLAEKGCLSSFKNKTIFLNQNNELKKANEAYNSFGNDLGLLSWLSLSYLHPEVVPLLNDQLKLPIKNYNAIEFIRDYVLPQKAEVDSLLEVESNNRNFYRFLFRYQEQIGKDTFKDLKYFKVWGRYNDYISSFSENIYLYNENLEKLLNANVFPDGQVYMLPQNFFGPVQAFKDWNEFFQKFNVKLYEATTFIKTEIIPKVKDLEKHFDNYDAFEEGETPTELYLQKKSANAQLWAYIHGVLPKFSGEEIKAIKKQLGALVVFTSEHCTTKALKECWLSKSYTDDDTVDGLVDKFPDVANQVTFVSADYLGNHLSQSKWRDLFTGCSGKTNEKEFVNLLKDKIGSLSEDNIVEATKFLFKHQDLIENVPINVKLTDGAFAKPSDAVVGKFYTDDDSLETILPSIPIQNLISEEYLTGTGKNDKWVGFFRKLGVKILDSEASVIEYKIAYLLDNQKEINTPTITFSHVHVLTELYSEKKLSDSHYKKLQGLELLLKYSETNFKVASDCHLSSEYNPKLDLDKLLPDDNKPAIFVSEKYDKKGLSVRSFFRKIGVESSFQVVKRQDQTRAMLLSHNLQGYLNYIDNANFYSNIYKSYSSQHGIYEYQELLYDSFLTQFEVARHFWKDFFPVHQNLISQVKYWVQNKKTHFSIPSPFEYFIKHKPTIPTLAGECNIPDKLFSFRFKDIIEDKNLVCIPELSEIILNNGQSIEKWLGIQQELSLELCLQRIQKISNYRQLEEEGIWDRIRQISKQDINQTNQSIIAQFHQEGKLPNQLDSWRAIRELFYLEDFDLGIGNSPQIIKQEIADIAAYLGAASLNSNDFKPEYKNSRQDDLLYDVLKSRLKFIAFAESQNDWENVCERLCEIVEPFNFFSVSKIAFCYNKVEPVIENSEKNFHQEEQKIYYVGKWDGPRAVEVFEFLHSVMKLQISLSLFKNLLLNDEKEIIEYFEEKNLTVPDEWRTIEPINIEESIEDKVKIPEKKSTTTHNETIDKPYSPIVDKIIKDLDGLNRTSQQDYHKEATQAGLLWLENNGWNLNSVATNEWGELENVVDSDSQSYTIIIRSAVAGLLRLNQYSWLHLEQSKYKLLVKTGGGANDFRLYHSQQDLLDDPKNEKNVIVKQNTKRPEVLTNMFENLEDEDKAHLYFVSNQQGASIFESLMKPKSSGEAGTADESDLY